jgi:hypothetical protein
MNYFSGHTLNKILFISRLDVWFSGTKGVRTAGNQSMFNTLKGFAENGIRVTLLTDGDEYDSYYELTRYGVIVIKSHFKHVRKLAKRVITLIESIKNTFNYPVNYSSKSPAPDSNHPYSNRATLFFWTFFALIECIIINFRFRANLFYGYEYSGVPVAFFLGKFFNKPSVARYQGTRLGFYLDNYSNFSRCRDTIAAMKLPVSHIIMGDDGTQGDKDLQIHGVDPT